MSGQLVGEILDAAEAGYLDDLSANAFAALIVIADRAHTGTRQASVRAARIASAIRRPNAPWCATTAGSRSTVERAIRELKNAGRITVVKRGFNNAHGKAQAPIYEVAPFPSNRGSVSVTQDDDLTLFLDGPTDGRSARVVDEPSPADPRPTRNGARSINSPPSGNSKTDEASARADAYDDLDGLDDNARQFVEEILAFYLGHEAKALSRQIPGLLADGYDGRDISDGLWKWHKRYDAGPGLLRNIVGDARKANRAADAAVAQLAADRAAATDRADIRRAIDDCDDCDAYGLLDDLTDCPGHGNFRQSRVS